MNNFLKKENGDATIVEATLLLPFCIIIIIALFYASIFVCQRANLQANLQTTLIYYKNTYSDNYIDASQHFSYSVSNDTNKVGSSFTAPIPHNPYDFVKKMEFDKESFKKAFRSMYKNMFFDDGSNIEITVDTKNYIVYKSLTATAEQTVVPAINIAMVGASNKLTIKTTATAVVTDSDDMIRNIDFVVDIFNQTSLGKKAAELVDKGKDYCDKFKKKLGINEEG